MLKLNMTVPKDQIKDHQEWVKKLITIDAAGIGALVYKFDDHSPAPLVVKISSVMLVASMLTLFVAYAGLINHQSKEDDVLSEKGSIPLGLGWALFGLSFGCLVLRFF